MEKILFKEFNTQIKGRIGEWVLRAYLEKKGYFGWQLERLRDNAIVASSSFIGFNKLWRGCNRNIYQELKYFLTPNEFKFIKKVRTFDFLIIKNEDFQKFEKIKLISQKVWEIYGLVRSLERDIQCLERGECPIFNFSKDMADEGYKPPTLTELKENLKRNKRELKNRLPEFIKLLSTLDRFLVDAKFCKSKQGVNIKNNKSLKWSKKHGFKIKIYNIIPAEDGFYVREKPK